jgi:beta-glucanase (GH16 family)
MRYTHTSALGCTMKLSRCFSSSTTCLALLTVASLIADAAAAPPSWRVVFFDDFDGTSLNASAWQIAENRTHSSPLEAQLYLARNVRVQDSTLVITTRRDNVIGPDGKTPFLFSSGWISGRDRLAFSHGRFEVRARLPAQNATGAWPAHWLLPQSAQCWPTGGEIDIMEYTSNIPGLNGIVGTYVRQTTRAQADMGILELGLVGVLVFYDVVMF